MKKHGFRMNPTSVGKVIVQKTLRRATGGMNPTSVGKVVAYPLYCNDLIIKMKFSANKYQQNHTRKDYSLS